ncbi:MAG: type II secretion system protein [Rhodanobacter sp.]
MTIIDSAHRRERGLTLLEMMVVLLVGGMAIALGFQSLGQWRRANIAMSQVGRSVQQTALIEAWFLDTVHGLVPILGTPFEGEEDRIVGTTIQPVQLHQGGTTHVTWSIENLDDEARLTVSEEGKSFSARLPGVTRAQFSFVDKDGRVYRQWPPKLGLHQDLPSMVTLRIELDSGRTQQWAGAIVGARMPYYTPFEAEPE